MTAQQIAPDTRRTLEEERAAFQSADAAEFKRKHEFKRSQARIVWPLFLRWSVETGLLSRRQFMVWLTGEADPAHALYDLLNAGRALNKALDFGYGVSDLAYLGRALDKWTPADILALPDAERVERCKALVVTSKETGMVELPTAALPSVRDTIKRVSDSDNIPAPEALALIVQGHAALSPELQASAIEAARSGRTLTDAAQHVVRQMLDSRQWLSRQACMVPGCGLPSAELHHLKAGQDTRFRSRELLAPLCARHHQAQHGTQAAHANHQADWIAQHWPTPEAFWLDLAALYADRLFGASGGINYPEERI